MATTEELQFKADKLKFLSVIGCFFVFWGIVIVGLGVDHVSAFIFLPAFFIVGCLTLGGLLVSFTFLEIISAFSLLGKNIFTKRSVGLAAGKCPRLADLKTTVALCELGGSLALGSGLLGTLIGTIKMLSGGLDDPNALACGFATLLIIFFYALVLTGFFMVGRVRLEQVMRQTAPPDAEA